MLILFKHIYRALCSSSALGAFVIFTLITNNAPNGSWQGHPQIISHLFLPLLTSATSCTGCTYLLFFPNSVVARVCVCMQVCVRVLCVCVDKKTFSSVILKYHPWFCFDTGSLPRPMLTYLVRRPRDPPVSNFPAGITLHTITLGFLFSWILRLELRSSCLQEEHLTEPSPQPKFNLYCKVLAVSFLMQGAFPLKSTHYSELFTIYVLWTLPSTIYTTIPFLSKLQNPFNGGIGFCIFAPFCSNQHSIPWMMIRSSFSKYRRSR